MGEARSPNIALSQNLKAHYLIRLPQLLLLVSLSLCSFLFSPSSLLPFLHCFSFYFSFPLRIFSHTIDKSFVFLLCNSLLVFVGMTRSFSRSTPDLEDGNAPQSQFSEAETEDVMIEKEESEVKTSEIAEEEEEEEEEDIEMAIEEEDEEERGKGRGQLGLKGEVEGSGTLEEKGSKREEFLIEENEEGKEIMEEENWRLTTEEMNKKFDDFIRRMKKDLGIQADRQLVMV